MSAHTLLADDAYSYDDEPRADLFTEIAPYHVSYPEAQRIYAALALRKKYTHKHLKYVRKVIKNLGSYDFASGKEYPESFQRAMLDHLIRYRKLATICEADEFDEEEYFAVEALIERRKKLVNDILSQAYKQYLKEQVFRKLPYEKQMAFAREYVDMMNAMNGKIKLLEEELTIIEQKLCADDRTFLEKYGIIIGWSVGLLVGGYALKRGIDFIWKWMPKKDYL